MVSRETCIELLEQFIFDEDRTVTYKVLSQELDIHVNIAKQYLTDFFKIQKSKNVPLQVSYFLAGISEEDGRKVMKVVVVSEDNLEEIKKLLNVTSCHIYSISKSKADKCSLLKTEKHCNENGELNKYFGIKHPTIQTKPAVLKKINVKNDAKSVTSNQGAISTKNGSNKKDSTKIPAKVVDAIKEKTNSEEKGTDKKESEKNKASSKGQKSNPLASMWQKKEKSKDIKTENSKPETKGKNKSPGNSKTVPVAKNNIMSMFSKQTVKNSENPKKDNSKPSEPKKEINLAKPEEQVKDVKQKTSSKQIPVKASSSKRKSTSHSKKSKLKSNSESEDEAEQPKKKKHRRICTFDDSDSESENEEARDKAQRSLLESETPVESPNNHSSPMSLTDDEEPIPPTPQDTTKGRKRILKTVQKTFKDEDGFFVTKQEKELVSASESEDESPIPRNNKETIKQNLFSYRKQSSLTSFFKQS